MTSEILMYKKIILKIHKKIKRDPGLILTHGSLLVG